MKLEKYLKLEKLWITVFFCQRKDGCFSIISVYDVGTFIYQTVLSKKTFSVVFFCDQDCCFVPVFYMVQGAGVFTESRLFGSLILDRSLVFQKSQFQVSFTWTDVNKKGHQTRNLVNNACYFIEVRRVFKEWALEESTLTLTDISNLARIIPNTTNLLWPKLCTTESIHMSRTAMTKQHFTNKCNTL